MTDIYADTADLESIRQAKANPIVKGFTTNPSLMRKAGVKDYEAFAKDALQIVEGMPISFEVFSDDFGDMYRQAVKIASWGDNVNVKIPITNTRGLSSIQLIVSLAQSGVPLNITAVFTVAQIDALLGALRLNNDFIISIFAGRIADTGVDPQSIMEYAAIEAHLLFQKAKILWASPREVLNVKQAELCGCDIITLAPELLKKLELFGIDHEDYSLETVRMFYDDARKSEFTL